MPSSQGGFVRSGEGVSGLKAPANVWSTSGIVLSVCTSGTPYRLVLDDLLEEVVHDRWRFSST